MPGYRCALPAMAEGVAEIPPDGASPALASPAQTAPSKQGRARVVLTSVRPRAPEFEDRGAALKAECGVLGLPQGRSGPFGLAKQPKRTMMDE